MPLYLGSDNLIQLKGLKDENGSFIIDATVTATVTDFKENPVSSVITLNHDTGGDYSGIVDSSINLTASRSYKIKITAQKDSLKKTWFDYVPVVWDEIE